ncbi:MAG: hypothetical protein ACOZBW_11110, partial [Thermodesulfobacteriota bacterium]
DFNHDGTSFVCLSTSKSLSVSKSNFMSGGSLLKTISLFFIHVLFLPPRKVPKEARPAAWPSASLAQAFFRRGQELARLRRAQTACPLFPENPACARLRRKGRRPSLTPRLNSKNTFPAGTLF